MSSIISSLLFIGMVLVTYVVLSWAAKSNLKKAEAWTDEYKKWFKIIDRAILTIIVIGGLMMTMWTRPSIENEGSIQHTTVPDDVEAQQAPVVTNVVDKQKEVAHDNATKDSLDAMEEARRLFGKDK